MTATDKTRQLELERGHIIEYVGGPRPYFWIGGVDGVFFDAVDAAALVEFVERVRANG